MPAKPMTGAELRRERQLSFTFIVGSKPPPITRVSLSIYSGVWEAVENLEIMTVDTPRGDHVIPAGYSEFAELSLGERLKARRAVSSTRQHLRKINADYKLEAIYDDENLSVHVRKVPYGVVIHDED